MIVVRKKVVIHCVTTGTRLSLHFDINRVIKDSSESGGTTYSVQESVLVLQRKSPRVDIFRRTVTGVILGMLLNSSLEGFLSFQGITRGLSFFEGLFYRTGPLRFFRPKVFRGLSKFLFKYRKTMRAVVLRTVFTVLCFPNSRVLKEHVQKWTLYTQQDLFTV